MRRGTVLVAVLVVTALAAMVAASLMYRLHAEVIASSAGNKGEQAYAAALSGMERAMAVARTSASDRELWYDNPNLFKNQLVCDDGANRWYFTIYAPAASTAVGTGAARNESDIRSPQRTGPRSDRYGLTDEASKINANVADRETLLALPNMTEELVDCLIDYRDSDSEPQPNGAEQDYYSQLKVPYAIKNGPLSTIEELLLVKGFNASIIYGEDANLNGRLDPNEDDGDESFPPDNADGQIDTGLRGVATTTSCESDVDGEGKPRVNINGEPKDLDDAGLPAATAEFIKLYRLEGNLFKHPSELLEMRYKLKQDQSGHKAGEWLESGVGAGELPTVLDRLTTRGQDRRTPLAGLVNVNTAGVAVLSALPGIDAELAQRIVEARAGLDTQACSTIAWLYANGLMDADTFKAIAPRLTARSFQFHLQCIGFGLPCGRYRVIEAVIDLADQSPRISYLRDVTRLGPPFPLNVEQQESRR